MMYNRYVPQPDGTYTRCRMQDKAPQQSRKQRSTPRPGNNVPPPVPCPPPPPEPPRQGNPPCKEGTSIPDFFRQILPKGLDTGDLLVILLLLLMAGDCKQDKNTAMLTLVLYMFL